MSMTTDPFLPLPNAKFHSCYCVKVEISSLSVHGLPSPLSEIDKIEKIGKKIDKIEKSSQLHWDRGAEHVSPKLS